MKNKFKFFLSALLILLLCIGLNTFCYASTPTAQELKNFFDFVIAKEQAGELNYTYDLSNSETIANAFYNNTQNINYSVDNLVFVSAKSAYRSGIGKVNIKGLVFIANNTFGHDGLPFLYINYNSGTGSTNYYKNSSNNVFTPCFFIFADGTFAFDNSFNGTIGNSNNKDRLTINSDNSYIVTNFILTTLKTCSFYYYKNNKYIPVLNNFSGSDYYDMYPQEPDIPDEPSGDTSGTTGTITNQSGDTIGKIDLSGIEQGLGAVKEIGRASCRERV